jgi:hypothetical protein
VTGVLIVAVFVTVLSVALLVVRRVARTYPQVESEEEWQLRELADLFIDGKIRLQEYEQGVEAVMRGERAVPRDPGKAAGRPRSQRPSPVRRTRL